MGYSKPKITLGGVAMSAPNFRWDFTPGANPYRQFWVVPNSIADKLKNIQNPTTLVARFDGQIGGDEQTPVLKVQNLWVQQLRRVDPAHWVIEVSDIRSRWRGQRFTWTANRTWQKNDFGDVQDVEGLRAENDPAQLRILFDRFRRFRYLPWSTNEDGTPMTALQLLVRCMDHLGTPPVVECTDNNVVFERQIWEEEQVAAVLTELAAHARCDIAADADGTLRLYSIDDPPPGDRLPRRPPVGAGVLYMQDWHRIRPASAHIRYRKREEVAVLATEEYPNSVPAAAQESPLIGPTRHGISAEDYETGKAVACYNVVQLPIDYPHPTQAGVTMRRNTWVPMGMFLAMAKISEDDIRRLWWEDLMEIKYAVVEANRGVSDGPDPLKLLEVQTIRQHYRQTWQMDPWHVQRWESWDTSRASLVDPVTRTTAPSPVWTDFCHVPTVFPAAARRNVGLWKQRAHNYRQTPDDGPATHGSLKLIDAQLGVFQVEYPPDLDGVINTVLPFALVEESIPRFSPAAEQSLWLGAEIDPTHNLVSVVSRTPAVDANDEPTDERYFTVSLASDNGEGPDVEWLVAEEYARYPHPLGLEDDDIEKQTAEAGTPANLPILVAVAQARATAVLNSYRDRLAGLATYPGIGPVKLFGNCRAISVELNGSGLRTQYDLTHPPADPQLVHNLTADQRQYLYGQLPQR